MTADERYNHALLRDVLEAANVCLPDTHAIIVIVKNIETGATSSASDLEQDAMAETLGLVRARALKAGPDGDIVVPKGRTS